MRLDQLEAIREDARLAVGQRGWDYPLEDIEFLLAEVDRRGEVLQGLLEIAELAMPDSYFRTDSRVASARAVLAGSD